MEEVKAGESLFESMARARGEWLAQGAMIHAIHTQSKLRHHLARLAGASAFESYRLYSESGDDRTRGAGRSGGRRSGVSRWRPDLKLIFLPEKECLRIELKLWASLTSPQRRELRKDGTLFIAPLRHRDRTRVCSFMSWADIARYVDDDARLKETLREIEHYSTGRWGRLALREAQAEFARLADGSDGRWPKLYRFLSTIDQVLHDRARDDYRPSPQWALSRSSPESATESYYGYYFSLSGRAKLLPLWLGFTRDVGGAVRFAVQRRPRRGLKWSDEYVKTNTVLDAEKLAAQILSRCT